MKNEDRVGLSDEIMESMAKGARRMDLKIKTIYKDRDRRRVHRILDYALDGEWIE